LRVEEDQKKCFKGQVNRKCFIVSGRVAQIAEGMVNGWLVAVEEVFSRTRSQVLRAFKGMLKGQNFFHLAGFKIGGRLDGGFEEGKDLKPLVDAATCWN